MTELKVNRELIKGDAVTERYEPSITINQLQTEKNGGYFNLGHIYLLLSLYSRWLFPDIADMIHFSNKAWENSTCMTSSKQLVLNISNLLKCREANIIYHHLCWCRNASHLMMTEDDQCSLKRLISSLSHLFFSLEAVYSQVWWIVFAHCVNLIGKCCENVPAVKAVLVEQTQYSV